MRYDNKFSDKLGYALIATPSKNALDSVSKAFLGFGEIADDNDKKKKDNALLKYNIKRKSIDDAQHDFDFSVKHKRISEKIEDNHRLAKLMSSGLDFDTFTKQYGDFKNPTSIKIAKDFTNREKSLLSESQKKEQWAFLSSDPRFKSANGSFDYNKATSYLSGRIRRGEIDPLQGATLIDGLHQIGKIGVYSAQRENKKPEKDILLERGKASLLKKALKIQDPKMQSQAIADIGRINSMEALGLLGGKIQEYDTSASISVDKKKASQKYAVQVGNFLSTSKRLESMIDDYNPEFTGMIDTAQENALQGTDFADPRYTAYKKNMGNIFLDFKELNNMGASFTKSEQEMMRNAMPNLNSSDDEYKRDMIDFTKLIRDKVKSKIIALDSANYNTGELKKISDYYDSLVEKVESKFGNIRGNEPTNQENITYF